MHENKIHTDEQILTLLKQGDRTAFAQVYEQYWAVLYAHALRMLGDRQEAEDVLQDVFASFWQHIDQLDSKTSLSAYLYVSVRNKVLNKFSRDKNRQIYVDSFRDFVSNGENTTDHQVRFRELQQLIEDELANMPPKMKSVFEMSRKENLSHQEIAEKTGISTFTIKRQINKALKKIRNRLGR